MGIFRQGRVRKTAAKLLHAVRDRGSDDTLVSFSCGCKGDSRLQFKDARQPVGWATVWLTLPAWLIVAIELVGEWRLEKGHSTTQCALNLGAWYNSLAVLAFALLAMAPFLIAFGWSKFFGKSAIHNRMFRPLILFFAVSFLASLLSCLWTCSGHPTWISGYTQR